VRPGPTRRIYLLAVYTARRWFSDGCPAMASSLTLQTLLSVVPLVGVLMSLIRVIDPKMGREFLEQAASGLSPMGARRTREFSGMLFDLGDNVNVTDLGIWGFLVVILLAYLLFATLERTFNRIWRNTRERRAIAKFTTFYTLATLFPVVMIYSLAQPMLSELTETFLITPALTTAVGLVLINRQMPRQEVRWGPAILGGLVSALLFEATKFGFGKYLTLIAMQTYEGVYGSLAILPVFVVWSYVSWLIVLLGAQTAFVAHHIHSVEREGFVHPTNQTGESPHAAPGRAAAKMLLAICDNFDHRETGSSAEELDSRFGLGLARTSALLDHLEYGRFIVPVAGDANRWVPGWPLDQIRVAEVLGIFDSEHQLGRADGLEKIYLTIDEFAQGAVGGMTYRDLLLEERERRMPPPAEERRGALGADLTKKAEDGLDGHNTPRVSESDDPEPIQGKSENGAIPAPEN
jgi:YihY family inner membrane protein